ncbi:MAG: hypothetical protein F6K42_24845 [Leptolyngbya sp. SIO1D8]|nr:hypothetical protein [Leptolyngbya sp. SIO1D8]
MMKQISSKRAKTDADFEEMSRIEWYASLYADKGRVCLPSEVLEAALICGSRKMKLGKQAQAGLFVQDNAILAFNGDHLSIDELWQRDQNRFTVGVRIQRNKVMRTRFRVDEWKSKIEVCFNDELLNPSQVDEILSVTGMQVGVGDWRPKFGRFSVETASSHTVE